LKEFVVIEGRSPLSCDARSEGGSRTKGSKKYSTQISPLITLVTVVFNGAATLEHTIRSVIEQTYDNVEYIIIDGGSIDATLDILRKYEGSIDYWVSEKDSGIYDAMNKGITLARGEIVAFINADDFYASPGVLTTVAAAFKSSGADCCYGDLCYVSQVDPTRTVRYWRSADFVPGSFEKSWCPPHPTFFVRCSVYQRLGGFDLSFKIAADFELMARYLEVARISSDYIPEVLVKMRLGGTSNRSLSNIFKQNVEIRRALSKHGLRSSLVSFVLNKLVTRAIQFVRRPA
jgi:glycosyltransferase involved in cell wall biosynthesis